MLLQEIETERKVNFYHLGKIELVHNNNYYFREDEGQNKNRANSRLQLPFKLHLIIRILNP